MLGTLRQLRVIAPAVVGIGILAVPSSVAVAACAEECKPKTEESDDLKLNKCKKKSSEEGNQTELEKCIAKCRKDFAPVKSAFTEYAEQALEVSKDTTKAVIRNVDYLQNCAPTEVKVGTIVGSGLFGMLLGFRRGLIRKLFYGTIGATTAAAIIYPCEAKVVAAQGCVLTKKYALMAYNYLTGAGGSQCPKKECKKKKIAAERGDCAPTPKEK